MFTRIVLFLCCFQIGFSQTKDSTAVPVAEEPTKSIIKDTVIDGKSQTIKTVNPVIDSLSLKALEDHPQAIEIDEKWLEELYSSSLFDTIYKSISELKYEEVYFPELPTDTLKKRLKELDAKTPFNIEYNPSLESVIKGYLNSRRKSFEKFTQTFFIFQSS